MLGPTRTAPEAGAHRGGWQASSVLIIQPGADSIGGGTYPVRGTVAGPVLGFTREAECAKRPEGNRFFAIGSDQSRYNIMIDNGA